MEQHRLLALNQTTLCSQWGTALRHLILLNEPLDLTACDNYGEVPSLIEINPQPADPVPKPDDSAGSNAEKRTGDSRFGKIQHL